MKRADARLLAIHAARFALPDGGGLIVANVAIAEQNQPLFQQVFEELKSEGWQHVGTSVFAENRQYAILLLWRAVDSEELADKDAARPFPH